mgnify:CR=1 FL=1
MAIPDEFTPLDTIYDRIVKMRSEIEGEDTSQDDHSPVDLESNPQGQKRDKKRKPVKTGKQMSTNDDPEDKGFNKIINSSKRHGAEIAIAVILFFVLSNNSVQDMMKSKIPQLTDSDGGISMQGKAIIAALFGLALLIVKVFVLKK